MSDATSPHSVPVETPATRRTAFDARLSRFSDWLNPILIKETRQATKSIAFAMVFLFFLAISWFVLLATTIAAGESLETRAWGEDFFYWFYGVLSFATMVIVPFTAYRSLLTEREHNTYELLSISTLKPQQVVRGKLASAMLQVFLYYGAIGPFIAFASLLQGFNVLYVSWVLVCSFLWSLALCIVSLLISVASKFRQWQVISLVGLIVLLLWGWGLVLGMVVGSGLDRELDDPWFWTATTLGIIFGLSYVVLALQITTARLTFAAGNRSTGIRVVLVVQFWMLMALAAGMALFDPSLGLDEEFQTTMAVLSGIHWSVAGVFIGAESDFLSRRIRARLPKRSLARWLAIPFLPGGSRGLILVLGHAVAMVVILVMFSVLGGSSEGGMCGLAMGLHVCIWTGLAAALTRWGRRISYRIGPLHVRLIVFLLFLAIFIFSFVPLMVGDGRLQVEFSWVYAWNPALMVSMIHESRMFTGVVIGVILLASAAVLVQAFNVKAMGRGIRQVVQDAGPGSA